LTTSRSSRDTLVKSRFLSAVGGDQIRIFRKSWWSSSNFDGSSSQFTSRENSSIQLFHKLCSRYCKKV